MGIGMGPALIFSSKHYYKQRFSLKAESENYNSWLMFAEQQFFQMKFLFFPKICTAERSTGKWFYIVEES